MSKLFRAAATAVATMLLLGVLVVPASADTNALALINGVAEVGKWFSVHCGKDGAATVTGRGLYLPNLKTVPGVNNGNREEHGVFHFETIASAFVATNQAGDPPHETVLHIELCGYLSPHVDGFFVAKPEREDGLGAACGATRAHDGRGWITDLTTGQIVQVQEFGWLELGGTAAVTGKYVEIDEATGAKKTKPVLVDPEGKGKGSVLGTLLINGGAPCTGFKTAPTNGGNGAQTFSILGGLKLLNDVNGVANTGDKCKKDGAPAGIGPDGKKSHANKPDVGPCPEKDAA